MMDATPTETLVDRLYRFEAERPTAPALESDSGTVDWARLGAWSNRIANALIAAGLDQGQRIAILAPGSAAYVALVMGALKAGLSVAPLPTLLAADTIERMVRDSDARLVFAAQALSGLAEGCGVRVIGLDLAVEGGLDLAGFIADAPPTRAGRAVGLDDEFNIIYSSGTTGRPKGIVQSHRMRATAALTFGAVGFPDGARTLATTALYSNWTMGAMIYTLWAGGCLRLLGKFSVESLLRASADFQPHNIFMVPVQITRLLEYVANAAAAPPPPALKWSAGSYLSPTHKQALLDWWPGGLVEIYGMTEGAPFTMLQSRLNPDKLHSVGRADPVEDLKIIDDEGRECAVGERGEVVGRVRSVMKGYHNDPEATQALVWRDPDGNSWFRSGDIGALDADGFLEITGRKKDMIISGGFNIYAADIEEVLAAHPAVFEAAVFAVPSRRWGESPAAAVVLRDGAAAEADSILAWVNARLGSLQRLCAVVIREELPRGSLDKVLRRELREAHQHLGDSERDA
jgi:long-chain acyl-CoA synthetase